MEGILNPVVGNGDRVTASVRERKQFYRNYTRWLAVLVGPS